MGELNHGTVGGWGTMTKWAELIVGVVVVAAVDCWDIKPTMIDVLQGWG